MIDQAHFSFLLANVFAIAEQVFARQCRLFLQTVAETESAGFSMSVENLQGVATDVDYQQVLDNSYAALESLDKDFSLAWHKADKILLQKILAMLPPQLPNLIYKINGQALVGWVDYVAGLPEENAFSRIHQYCQALLQPQQQCSAIVSALRGYC